MATANTVASTGWRAKLPSSARSGPQKPARQGTPRDVARPAAASAASPGVSVARPPKRVERARAHALLERRGHAEEHRGGEAAREQRRDRPGHPLRRERADAEAGAPPPVAMVA